MIPTEPPAATEPTPGREPGRASAPDRDQSGGFRPRGPLRRVVRWSRRLGLALLLVVLSAAGFSQWWLLPRVNNYRETLAAAVGDYLHTPVQIAAVSATHEGGRLMLRLQGVSLRDPQGEAVLAHFERATADLDLWQSLQEWRPIFGSVRLEGVDLTLELGEDGMPRLRADASAASDAASLPEIAHWLFEVGQLDLIGDRLTVRLPNGRIVQLRQPYFQARTSATGQQVAFSAALPAELGDHIELRVDRVGAGADVWQGTFSARAERLNLAAWPLPLSFATGEMGLELRGEWRDWQPIRIEGQLQWLQATLAQPQRLTGLQRWLARHADNGVTFSGAYQASGWQWRGAARFSDARGRVLARPSFDLTQSGEQWRGRARHLRAQDLTAGLSPWLDDAARQWLTLLDPVGDIPEVTLQANSATAAYAVTAQLRAVAFQPARGLPGLGPLHGVLEWAPERGRIALDSRKVRVETAGLLRAPITLDTLAGTVSWVSTAAGVRLDSSGLELANADLNARVWGRVTVPATGTPLLDLQCRYHDVAVSAAPRYLPVAVIPAEGIAWLDQALVGGRVVAGEGVLRGPAAAFPFDRDEGLFETRFQVEDATLEYAPGWPRLQAARGVVQFRNRGLQVAIESGRLLDAEVARIAAQIDDLDAVVVQVQGRAQGPAASLWRALQDSPIRADLGDNWPALGLDGDSALALELTIPIDERPLQARGQVEFMGNQLTLPAWKLAFEQLRGVVHFTEAGLDAKNLQTRWRGEAIRLDLDLVGRAGQRDLRVRLRGRSDPRVLAGPAEAQAWEPYLSGKSLWDAVLTVPTTRRTGQDAISWFNLTLRSDLRGLAVRLPAPLGKSAADARSLKIMLHPQGQDALGVLIDYGDGVRAALELSDVARTPRLARGELRINTGAAKLPKTPGLTVVADVPRWEWNTLNRATPNSTVTDWSRVQRLDARIGQLILGGQVIPKAVLSATQQEQELQITLEGANLAGRVTLPKQPSPQRPINAALQRLYFSALPDAAPSPQPSHTLNPRQLPPLVLTVADLRWDGMELGRLRVVALPQASGMRLAEFTLDSERQRVDAIGDWRWSEQAGHASHLHAVVRSPALGETLAALGYARVGIARGATEAELMADWPDAWPELALERLEGTLKIRVGPGQLLDVEPGMGRMMGLLNMQALLRRFTLDFSDLFQQGMSFDRISGEFVFQKGRAQTDNLTIEGPAARIEIKGQTDLQKRLYDQRITVIPMLGGALPVAGTLLGGPVAGAAALVAERLLQQGIQHATRYDYRLQGSWDQPVLEAWRETPTPAESKGFASDNHPK